MKTAFYSPSKRALVDVKSLRLPMREAPQISLSLAMAKRRSGAHYPSNIWCCWEGSNVRVFALDFDHDIDHAMFDSARAACESYGVSGS